MSINFAINYSKELAELVRTGQVHIDIFKCPAWPELVAEAQDICPVYVHFPLIAGGGRGIPISSETKEPVTWAMIEALLAQTDTRFINLHLSQKSRERPDIPVDTTDPAHIAMLTECMITDVQAVVDRFGREHVIVENVPGRKDGTLRPFILPDVIRHVVEATGCGFLFDVSHARISAELIGMDIGEYIKRLPVEHTREIHITGLQIVDDAWITVLRKAGYTEEKIENFAGTKLDHLPLIDADWAFCEWLMQGLRAGDYGNPWLVTLEYGGVGNRWDVMTDKAVLREQVPRLYALVKNDC
ncbi:MAG: DUF692 family protein [Anaerolineae bacterium]|nr:DUF692 family protein [Anaerolineae bacterium]